MYKTKHGLFAVICDEEYPVNPAAKKVIESGIKNFTQASIVETQDTSNFSFSCPERKKLDEDAKKLGEDHYRAIRSVNMGHDLVGVPLSPVARRALITQAKENASDGSSPFIPNRRNTFFEANNSIAFNHTAHSGPQEFYNENKAGAWIHQTKAFFEQAIVELSPLDDPHAQGTMTPFHKLFTKK